jgi:integrase
VLAWRRPKEAPLGRTGIKNAQALLGHADVGTTQMYTGAPTLDELAKAIEGYRFGGTNTRST